MATTDQSHFRFRNDDGSEAAATWIAAVDTEVTVDAATIFRLRFAIKETSNFFFEGEPAPAPGYWLFYNLNAAGLVRVTTTSPAMQSRLSTHFADGDSCTQQISAPDLYKALTELMDEDGQADLNGRFRGRTTETEWSLQLVPADLNDGDVFSIALRRGVSGQPFSFEAYSQTPVLRVTKTAKVLQVFTQGSVIQRNSAGVVTTRETEGTVPRQRTGSSK